MRPRPGHPPRDPALPRRPRARTSAGQHYLIDGGVLRRIAACASLTPEDTVLEVGAGPGNLTRRLAETGARVVAIEIDRRCEPNLVHLQREFPRLAIAWGDALDLDWEPLWEGTPLAHRVIVGNIPYQITSPLLGRLAEAGSAHRHAVLTVQREVAERLVAPPGSRVRGALTVKMALDLRCEIALRVPRSAFKPRPQVESAVIRLTPLAEPPVASPGERLRVRRVIEAAFGARRQQVVNALAMRHEPRASKAEWLARLAAAGVDPALRAENLTLDQFITLARLSV